MKNIIKIVHVKSFYSYHLTTPEPNKVNITITSNIAKSQHKLHKYQLKLRARCAHKTFYMHQLIMTKPTEIIQI